MAHIKRLAAPKTWNIQRKAGKFTTSVEAGPHNKMYSMPARTIFKTIIPLTETSTEADRMIRNQEILVDGKRITRVRLSIGLMDIVSIPATKQHYQIIVNTHGQLAAITHNGNDHTHKVCKIMKKTNQKGGKTQLTLHDGKTLLFKETARVGDSVILDVTTHKIVEVLPFLKGQHVYIIGGKHIGSHGEVSSINGDKVTYQKNGEEVTTLKAYAFVVAKTFTL